MPRRQKKYHYLYKTTCLVTNKFYVGMHSTDDLDDGYLGSGKILGYSIGKHGLENHKREILEFLPDRAALKQREKEVVNEELLADPLNMNLKYGGDGGQISSVVKKTWENPSRREKQITALKKCWQQADYRASRIAESSRDMKSRHLRGLVKYDTFTGKNHRPETKRKIGQANAVNQLGQNNSQFGTCWVTNGIKPIKIKQEDLDEYLQNGYSRGRK